MRSKKITPEDLWEKKTFESKTVAGLRSMKNGLEYTVLEEEKSIIRFRYKTGKKSGLLFDVSQFENEKIKTISDYAFNDDETKILLTINRQKIYRRSFTADFYIYDIAKKSLTPLTTKKKTQLAAFSPDGGKVAFVWKNNLYYTDLKTGKEKQITKDGRINKIINGMPDWVYEEEFFLVYGYCWSPESNRIAFYRFNESKVKKFSMTWYKGLYLEHQNFKYPKAGETNAVVSIHVYELKSGRTKKVNIGKETDQYIPRIKWTKNPGKLMILRLNRLQNNLEYLLWNSKTNKVPVILTETNERYIEINSDLTFTKDKKHFIVTSEQNGWNHLYLYSMSGKFVRQITTGNWDLNSFLGYDDYGDWLYYISSEASPMQRHLYRIRSDGSKKEKLTPRRGVNHVSFSKGFRYFICYHSSANTIPTVSLHTANGKRLRSLESNIKLKKTLGEYQFSNKEFFSFKTSESVKLNGWMMKPAKMSSRKKYPVLMTVYGGPGSQTVQDNWNFGWHHLLNQMGYIVVSIDNRGTGSRGQDFRKCTYKNLFQLETIDQIEGAKYLASLPFIDEARIGIFGWSYGGSMALSSLFTGADVFKTAVSVAPVTHYKYYNTIYTERYMRTPQENPKGYDDHAPITHIEKLKGNLLIVHGSADDNVHFQNAMVLTEELVKAKKQFEVHYLPDRDHGIGGGSTHLHLFTRMTNYLEKNL